MQIRGGQDYPKFPCPTSLTESVSSSADRRRLVDDVGDRVVLHADDLGLEDQRADRAVRRVDRAGADHVDPNPARRVLERAAVAARAGARGLAGDQGHVRPAQELVRLGERVPPLGAETATETSR